MVTIGNIQLPSFPVLLAPMEDVSDPPFRFICKKHGADLMFSEFVSSEGLIRDAAKSLKKLDIFEYERPVGIQIFGGDISSMKKSVEIATAAQPDLIDINFGCPVKKVVCKDAGAAILKNIPKMVAMTEEIVRSTSLPVTVKTRLGWNDQSKNIVEVAERLQDAGIKAITIHGRTREQLFTGSADWSLIGQVKNNPRMRIPVFGNGDITNPETAKEKFMKYGVDGIMIGRASIGNPWIFEQVKTYMRTGAIVPFPEIFNRIETVKTHLRKSIEWKGEKRGIFEMRRHYSNYFKGIPHFKDYRIKLVTAQTAEHIEQILEEIKTAKAELPVQ